MHPMESGGGKGTKTGSHSLPAGGPMTANARYPAGQNYSYYFV